MTSDGKISVSDTDRTTSNRDVTINGQHYGIGDSLKGATGVNGGFLSVQKYSYPSTSTTTSYTTSYYYVISGGYICVDSTSNGSSGSRSANNGIMTMAWWNDNLIEYGQWSSSTSRYEEKASFRSIGINVQPTGAGEYVSSRDSNAYPQKGFKAVNIIPTPLQTNLIPLVLPFQMMTESFGPRLKRLR